MRVACDGYRARDGRAAWAWVCTCGAREAGPLPAPVTSHVAEWVAAVEGLMHLAGHATGASGADDASHAQSGGPVGPVAEAVLQVDAALVAKGLAEPPPTLTGEAAGLQARCRALLADLTARGLAVEVARVPRHANAEADALARSIVAGAGPTAGPRPGEGPRDDATSR